MSVWDRLEFFHPDENWGDPSKMDPLLLMILDTARAAFGRPFIVHCGYETDGHAPNSFHYLGRAVDFHIKTDMPFSEQVRKLVQILEDVDVMVMTRYGVSFDLQADMLCGLGIYPTWNNPGFHLDTRGWRARWGHIYRKEVSFEEALVYAESMEEEI